MQAFAAFAKAAFLPALGRNCESQWLEGRYDYDALKREILLDINLPDIDVYEIARRLRTSRKTELARIPIVAVTVNAMKGEVQKILEARAGIHIFKPTDIQELLDTVKCLIRKEARGIKL